MKGNVIFNEEDLKECGICVSVQSMYSGLSTMLFREEFVLTTGKMYCFMLLSPEEYLAGFHVP